MGVWKSQATSADTDVLPRFTRAGMLAVPRDRVPDGLMLPQTAYQIVLDEVMLDGNARFNLATFVTTWMDKEADDLYAATVDKNMVDKDEYPRTAELERRCSRMLADLWHAPEPTTARKLVSALVPLRVSREHEMEGLDISQHGEALQ